MVEHEKIIGPTESEIDEINRRVEEQPDRAVKDLRLQFAGMLAGGMVAISTLQGCISGEITAEPTAAPTSQQEATKKPSPESSSTLEPTETPQPTIEAAGGSLPEWFQDEEVQQSINDRKEQIQSYVQKSDQLAVGPGEETGLSWNYYWNDETKAVEVNVAVKPDQGYPEGTQFTFSDSGEAVRMTPEEGEILGYDWERNTYVVKDGETSEVIKFLNEENQWEEAVNPEQVEKEQAFLNSEDPGIQELVEQGLKPEFYESGGAVVKGKYDRWLAVWHEGEWLRLKNLRSGGIPVETGVKKIEEKEVKGSPWKEATLAAYFLEEYWNDMNSEMGINNENITPYEGWFWKIGVANQATGELETFRIMVTARDQDGGTPLEVMGILIFQKAQEGQVAADMDAVLTSEDQGIAQGPYEEVKKYLGEGYSLGLNGLYTHYRIEEQLLDDVPDGRMPIIQIFDAVCGQEISDQDTRTLTENNAELLEKKKFEKLGDDALLGYVTSVSVPVFDNK